MLREGSIRAEHIWKRFRADRRGKFLHDHFQRFRARMRGEMRNRWRWALRDVDLSASPGEAIGLFGVNGSGKTTLLKILTRVMYPYAGSVEVKGRVGALIDVRAGIHPELSGRENIFLYGSLLGLPRREVARRFDEVVAFSELEDAIDRQVKFYSSGMGARLGFAVAAFMEPDVLLVDEVLAVGDASFQQKCLDRMRTVLAQGTTLVFVSHDLLSLEATCTRGIWLHNGQVKADGPVRESLSLYRRAIEEHAELISGPEGIVRLNGVQITDGGDGLPRSHGPLQVRLSVESADPRAANVHFGVSEGPATPIFSLGRALQLKAGQTELRCSIARLPLPRGRFYVWVGVFDRANRVLLNWHPVRSFDVMGPKLDPPPRAVVRMAPVHVDATWEVESNNSGHPPETKRDQGLGRARS
jgi:ABC-type polysaccharide/polyol phosphate transport system ATPase subunit